MKSIILCLFLILNGIAFGQKLSIESAFNAVRVGRNQSITLNYQHNKYSFYAGPKLHFNKLTHYPVNSFLKKDFYALNFKQRIGVRAGVTYVFADWDRIRLNAFWDIQFTKASIRHEYVLAVYPYITFVPEPQSEYDYAYKKGVTYIEPVIGVEQNIGIGFEINLWKGLYYTQKIGLGIGLFKENDPSIIFLYKDRGWSFTEILSFGLGYRLTKKK